MASCSAPVILETSFLFLPLVYFFLGEGSEVLGGTGTPGTASSAKLAEAASAAKLPEVTVAEGFFLGEGSEVLGGTGTASSAKLAEAASTAKLPEVTVAEGLVFLFLFMSPVLAFAELIVTAAAAIGTVSCLVKLSALGFLALLAVLSSDSVRAWMKASQVGSYLKVKGVSFLLGW